MIFKLRWLIHKALSLRILFLFWICEYVGFELKTYANTTPLLYHVSLGPRLRDISYGCNVYICLFAKMKKNNRLYTSRPAFDRIFLACTPSGSWLTSITSLFPRIHRVSLLADRMSHPISKGACQNKDFHLSQHENHRDVTQYRHQFWTNFHYSPNAKMRLILLQTHASIAHFQHVRIYNNQNWK